MIKILIVLLSLTATLSVLAAEGFSSLEEQMTGKEFTGAGLEKLSQQELDQLNEWIRKHSVATLHTPKTQCTCLRPKSRTAFRRQIFRDQDAPIALPGAELVLQVPPALNFLTHRCPAT